MESMARSAPSERAWAALSGPRPVVITRAPAALAIWMAVTPIPEVPPWMRQVSPGWRCPMSNRFAQTVKTVSGRDAASTKPRPLGMARACRASATAYPA